MKNIFQPKIDTAKSDIAKWNLNLTNDKNPFLYQDDVFFMQSLLQTKKSNLQITNTSNDKIYLKDLNIKIGNSKCDYVSLSKKLSSSEYEIIVAIFLIIGHYNLGKTIILDDPIEVSSWENEEFFIDFLNFLFSKKSDAKIILLTHRITLFEKTISLHKQIGKSNYVYFIDDIPFFIDENNPNFLKKNCWKKHKWMCYF